MYAERWSGPKFAGELCFHAIGERGWTRRHRAEKWEEEGSNSRVPQALLDRMKLRDEHSVHKRSLKISQGARYRLTLGILMTIPRS